MARKNNERSGCIILILATAVCLVLGLWGCDAFERFLGIAPSDPPASSQSASRDDGDQREQPSQQSQPAQQTTPSQQTTPAPSDDSATKEQQASQSAQAPTPAITEPTGYAYSQLSAADREKYRALLEVFLTREERQYPSTNVDDIGRIRDCILDDEPELYYVDNLQYVTTTDSSGKVTSVKVTGLYSYDPAQTASLQRQIDAEVSRCLAGAPAGDDYAKAKYFYEYLAANVSYDHDAQARNLAGGIYSEGQTIVESLVNHTSVCTGYARALQLLLQRSGIPCVVVMGPARGEAHVWCAAKLDGDWYFIDPTWGDSQITDEYGQPSGSERLNYDYLCVTSADLSATHVPDCPYPVPSCTATADNYYVREGLMLTSGDVGAAGAIIRAAAARGEGSACFRCANRDVFDQVFHGLIEEGAAFDYIPGDTYHYYYNDDMLTMELVFG